MEYRGLIECRGILEHRGLVEHCVHLKKHYSLFSLMEYRCLIEYRGILEHQGLVEHRVHYTRTPESCRHRVHFQKMIRFLILYGIGV